MFEFQTPYLAAVVNERLHVGLNLTRVLGSIAALEIHAYVTFTCDGIAVVRAKASGIMFLRMLSFYSGYSWLFGMVAMSPARLDIVFPL